MRRFGFIALAALAVIGAAAFAPFGGSTYHVKVLLGTATNMIVGGKVEVSGFKAGTVSALDVHDGKALVTLKLDKKYAPLHDGAKVTVTWKALLGERIVNIVDGPASNAKLPSNGMLPGVQADPVELDQVLNGLDPKTRSHLTSLVSSLDTTLQGQANTANLNATLTSAGPALEALGGVLRALGTDGPAIRNLVTRLSAMLTTVAAHDSDIRSVLDQVTSLTSATAGQSDALSATLQKLPGTVDVASTTLSHVPGVVAKADPLLKQLAPVTAELPGVARNLRPVLRDLRPASAQLRPTLAAAAQLLRYTPGLLDSADQTLPGIDSTLSYLAPAIAFLRPYTPEAMGFLTTWASLHSNYGSNGHATRAHVQEGLATVALNPGVMPPGVTNDPFPLPGANGGQPWQDAFGSGVR